MNFPMIIILATIAIATLAFIVKLFQVETEFGVRHKAYNARVDATKSAQGQAEAEANRKLTQARIANALEIAAIRRDAENVPFNESIRRIKQSEVN